MTILEAVKSGDPKQVAAELAAMKQHNQDVRLYRDNDGLTPLMYAARYVNQPSCADIVKALLDAGSDPTDTCFEFGNTALHYACAGANLRFVTALHTLRPQQFWPYFRNFNGRTPLAITQDSLDPTDSGQSGIQQLLDAARFARLGRGPIHLAIVGTGPAGTGLFVALLRELRDRRLTKDQLSQIQISLIDEKRKLGTGTPYSEELNAPTCLLNVAAGGMSVDTGSKGDFIYWLDRKQALGQLEAALGTAGAYGLRLPSSSGRGFYPRLTFGQYMADSVTKWVSIATQMGIKVGTYPLTSVTSQSVAVTQNGPQYKLELIAVPTIGTPKPAKTDLVVTHVFRSTGHWTETKPMPAPYLKTKAVTQFPASMDVLTARGIFAKPSNIAVLGSSLSAIDAIFTVLLHPAVGALEWDALGQNCSYTLKQPGFKVSCYSRKGLFSKVRPEQNLDLPLVYTSPEAMSRMMAWNGGRLSLADCVKALNREMSEQLGIPNIDVRAEVRKFDGPEYNDPSGKLKKPKNPFEVLQQEATAAVQGDGRTINQPYVRWYQVLHDMLPTMHLAFRQFSPEDRVDFDKNYNSDFLWALAPMPARSARVLLAMHKAGALDLYRAQGEPVPGGADEQSVDVTYKDYNDVTHTATHEHMLVTIGLGQDIKLDNSDYNASLVREGAVLYSDPRACNQATPRNKDLGVAENATITVDDGTFELLFSNREHSPTWRGLGYFTHSNIWDIQAVPAVVKYGAQVAEIYAEEFEERTKPGNNRPQEQLKPPASLNPTASKL